MNDVRKGRPANASKRVSATKEQEARPSSKRKATHNAVGISGGLLIKQMKKTQKQKSFLLASDKKKPDPLILKRVAFDMQDDGYGQVLLIHFGGLDKIANCLSNGRYLFGTIARLSKEKHGGACYEVEWEDSHLSTTKIALSCLILAIKLATTL